MYLQTSNRARGMNRARARRQMGGLGGASDCGAGQVWYPNLTYAGVTGQCATPAQAQQFLSSGMASGNMLTSAPGGGTDDTSVGSNVGAFFSKLFGGSSTPPPGLPYMPMASPGLDMTTLLLIGGAGLALFFVIKK